MKSVKKLGSHMIFLNYFLKSHHKDEHYMIIISWLKMGICNMQYSHCIEEFVNISQISKSPF